MSDVADAILDTFDSDVGMIWAAKGTSQVTARFEIRGSRVDVKFRETKNNEWHVSYTVVSETIKPTMQRLSDSLYLVCAVFQAVREFLEVRQPESLHIGSNNEDLAELCAAYLCRRDTALNKIGYKARPTVQVSHRVPFLVEKTMPSAWRNC